MNTHTSYKPAWQSWLVLLLAAFFLATNIRTPVNIFDEGYAAYAAWRIAAGDAPFRDFWTVYTPGTFYAEAGVFTLFGVNLLSMRVLDMFIRLALAFSGGFIALRLGAGRWSWLAFGLILLHAGTMQVFGYAAVWGLLFMLMTVLATLRAWRIGKSSSWIYVGVLAGWTFFFRQDFGLYILAIVCAWLLVRAWFAHQLSAAFKPSGLVCLFALLTALLSLSHGLAADAAQTWEMLFAFPSRSSTLAPYILPLPKPLFALGELWRFISSGGHGGVAEGRRVWAFFGSILILLWSFAHGLRMGLKDKEKNQEEVWGLFLLVLVGLGLFRQAVSRADLTHIFPMAFVAWIALAVLGAQSSRRKTLKLAIAACAFYFALVSLSAWKNTFKATFSKNMRLSLSPRAGWIPLNPHQDQAADLVRRKTPEGSVIYVANNNMKDLFINDVSFYFLAERACLSPYYMVNEQLQGKAEEKNRILKALKDVNTSAVVLRDNSWKTQAVGKSSLDLALRFFGNQVFSNGGYKVRLRADRE